jgi:AcrR family transcriptional regulator
VLIYVNVLMEFIHGAGLTLPVIGDLIGNIVLDESWRPMSPASSPGPAVSETLPEAPSRWEERSAHRVIETGRDQILERSRKIVDAAYELLETEGLEGLTIRAVLQKTGLARRAFYERFAGKDDLVLAVFEQAIRMATRFFAEEVDSVGNPMQRLRLIVMAIVLGRDGAPTASLQSSRRGAAMSREHLRLAESRPDDLQAAISPLLALLAKQLADGMQAGVVRQADPQRLATLVYNLVSTTVHTELLAHETTQPDPARRARLADEIWEFCRRAVAA